MTGEVTGSNRSVVVVGGGIAGLAAAWELTGGERPDPTAPSVTVLESSGRLGGPLRSEPFDGRMLDVGPDGFLGRRPEAHGYFDARDAPSRGVIQRQARSGAIGAAQTVKTVVPAMIATASRRDILLRISCRAVN